MTLSRGVLDTYARDYLRLVTDPCNAPLAMSVFPGAGGGIVSRFENDFIVGNSATDVATSVVWTPGYLNQAVGGSGGNCVVPSAPVISDNIGIAYNVDNAKAPGFTFLSSNAKAFRCIAACMQVSWPGTELNRQGIVGLGQVTQSVALSLAPTTSQLRTLSSHVGRMPGEVMELILKPTEASQRWCDPTIAYPLLTAQSVWGDSPSLLLSVAGIPVSTGVRVRLISIVEWLPQNGGGIVSNDAVAPKSGSTLNDVLRAVDAISSKDWVRSAGFTIGQIAATHFMKTPSARAARLTY